MPTVCASCYHVIVPDSKAPWFRWLCAAYKLDPEWNPVTGKYDRENPYAYCKAINRGDCSEFKEGPNCLNPRPMPPDGTTPGVETKCAAGGQPATGTMG